LLTIFALEDGPSSEASKQITQKLYQKRRVDAASVAWGYAARCELPARPLLGRLDLFAKPSANGRYLREADGRSRREAAIAERDG